MGGRSSSYVHCSAPGALSRRLYEMQPNVIAAALLIDVFAEDALYAKIREPALVMKDARIIAERQASVTTLIQRSWAVRRRKSVFKLLGWHSGLRWSVAVRSAPVLIADSGSCGRCARGYHHRFDRMCHTAGSAMPPSLTAFSLGSAWEPVGRTEVHRARTWQPSPSTLRSRPRAGNNGIYHDGDMVLLGRVIMDAGRWASPWTARVSESASRSALLGTDHADENRAFYGGWESGKDIEPDAGVGARLGAVRAVVSLMTGIWLVRRWILPRGGSTIGIADAGRLRRRLAQALETNCDDKALAREHRIKHGHARVMCSWRGCESGHTWWWWLS